MIDRKCVFLIFCFVVFNVFLSQSLMGGPAPKPAPAPESGGYGSPTTGYCCECRCTTMKGDHLVGGTKRGDVTQAMCDKENGGGCDVEKGKARGKLTGCTLESDSNMCGIYVSPPPKPY